jgi:hypothetical protein
MLNNLLNEYYVSNFGLQIYDISLTEKIKSYFFYKKTNIFFSLVPKNDQIKVFLKEKQLNFQQK